MPHQMNGRVHTCIARSSEAHRARAVGIVYGDDLAFEHHRAVVLELDERPGLETLTRFDQAVPGLLVGGIHGIGHLVEQQRLDRTARALLVAQQACRQHARLVHHQQVARTQVFPDITKDAVLDAPVAVHDHELAGVARNGGLLRYEPLG